MSKTWTVVSLACAIAGCRANPKYCEGNPGNNCDYEWDAMSGCARDSDCPSTAPICDLEGTGTCVQCTPAKSDECTGTTPVCSAANECAPCTSHTECVASDVCLGDGACADTGQVAYVDAAGTNNAGCTRTTPCNTVASGLATNRPYIKVTGTIDEAITVSGGRVVTFLGAPAAKLTRTNNGQLVRIEDTATVSFFDIEIGGALGTNVGVSIPVGSSPTVSLVRTKIAGNAGGGISAQGGTLVVSHSTIANNAGGGIAVMNGMFAIVGNMFFNNGAQLGSVGGVSITTSQNASNRLEFNSFNKNQTQDGLGCAIQCAAGTFTAKNNIMSGNGTATNMQQTGGTCMHGYSIARPGPVPPGTGNVALDPLFVDTVTGDLHIMASSPARDLADPNSDLSGVASMDLDNDRRTPPADLGADQIP